MGVSNRERIGKALDSLCQGLYPYVEQKMQAVHGSDWSTKAASRLRDHQKPPKRQADNIFCENVAALLTVVNREWDKVFKDKLSQSDRALINELIEVRNQWAHQSSFLPEDTYRAVDSVVRLLRSISASQFEEVERQRQEVLRSGGTDNNPEFTSVVCVAGSEYGSGKDGSTRKAEKRAAENALRKLDLL